MEKRMEGTIKSSLDVIIENCPESETGAIGNAFIVASSKIRRYSNIVVTLSGGSDSDIMLDMLTKLDVDKKIIYLFVNTGLEYRATKNHILFLERKYGVKIHKVQSKETIPVCCKRYGQPFVSKYASSMISRLQKHGFHWEDEPYETLAAKYNTDEGTCDSALKWWCNMNGEGSRFNIDWNPLLKEFILAYNPYFDISAECCHRAKKQVFLDFKKENNADLSMYGVRKAEGGIRAAAYKNCFTPKDDAADEFRPIFWMTDKDKVIYAQFYGVVHSACYTQYGLKRTGCVGCPYGQNLEAELEAAKKYEPNLCKAVCNVFKDSYIYTKMYREFQKTGSVNGVTLAEFKRNKAVYKRAKKPFEQLSFLF